MRNFQVYKLIDAEAYKVTGRGERRARNSKDVNDGVTRHRVFGLTVKLDGMHTALCIG